MAELGLLWSPCSCSIYHSVPTSTTPLRPTHVEVAIHVEADDAEVVGSGNIRDDAFSASALFGHPHPHVPVPELGAWKIMTVKRFGAGRGLQPTHPTQPGHLFRCGPLGLKLLLVQGLPEHPAQARHGLHTVQQGWVLSRVFISLRTEVAWWEVLAWCLCCTNSPADPWPLG